jgi:hypothetical protein
LDDVADKCAGLRFNCPACGKKFKNSERVPACPDCGADLHCGKWAVPGYKFCEDHGGPAPSRNFYGKGRGIVSGENSQFALTRLASTYVKMQKDGQILSNRAGIAVLDDRIVELLERMGKGTFPDQLATLHSLWEEYLHVEGTLEAAKVKRKLQDAFDAVYHDYMAFHQIEESLELRSKMVEREAKIAKDLHAILTAEDAYKLVAKLQASIIAAIAQEPQIPDAVKAHFLKRIEYEFTRIIGEGTSSGSDGSDGEVIDA